MEQIKEKQISYEEIDQKCLNCSFCNCQYNEKERYPISLCEKQHISCYKCFQKMVISTTPTLFKCPHCFTKTDSILQTKDVKKLTFLQMYLKAKNNCQFYKRQYQNKQSNQQILLNQIGSLKEQLKYKSKKITELQKYQTKEDLLMQPTANCDGKHNLSCFKSKMGNIYSKQQKYKNNYSLKNESNQENQNEYFIGQIQNNKKNGYGVQLWPDLSVYAGQWLQNIPNGKGLMIHTNKEWYHGDWKNGQANGFGVYYHEDGSHYEGNWLNDKKHGNGIQKWSNGQLYEGEYANGKMSGIGKYCWKEGNFYEGQWKDNSIEGKGTYQWLENGQYTGQWKNGQMHGFGIFTLKDGSRYQGQFQNNQRHGKGQYFFKNGDKFVSVWQSNSAMKGELHEKNGTTYQVQYDSQGKNYRKLDKQNYWYSGRSIK